MIGRIAPGKAGNPVALIDVAIRNAKPGAKAIKLADGGGIFLMPGESSGGSSIASMDARSCWRLGPIPKSALAKLAVAGRKRGS